MKKIYLIGLVLSAAALGACSKKVEPPAPTMSTPMESAKDSAAATGEATKDAAGNAGDAIKHTAEAAKEGVKDAAHATAEKARELKDDAKDAMKK